MSPQAPGSNESEQSVSTENASPPPEAPKTWKVGTLAYTKFGLVSIFAWMLWGDLVFTLVEGVYPTAMPLQLERLHIPQGYIPILMGFLSQIVFIPMNPYLSFRSDRYRSKYGRRIPYIAKTMIPLALCFAALGFTDDIGAYIHSATWVTKLGLSSGTVLLLTLGALLLIFDFFNAFINTIYWYLFADVIPRELMGRFTSLFRVTGMAAGSLFGFFVQRYIETHTKYIYLGAAVLYLVGFGLMCWWVKEGDYPPPKEIGTREAWYVRLWQTIQLYVRECFQHPVHVSLYANQAIIRLADAAMFGLVFFNRQFLHISQGDMGTFTAIMRWPGILMAFPLGWLVDRIHPLRASLISAFFAIPLNFILFYTDSFTFYIVLFCLRTPFTQLGDAAGQPLYVSIFPRKQYGQFCSANGTVRSLVSMAGFWLGGSYINFFVSRMGPRGDIYGYLWLAGIQCLAFAFLFLTYVYWKKHGAEKFSYDPDVYLAEKLARKAEAALAVAGKK
ncbi:MAG: hypothetical protein FWD61_11360 [Phycisphaerales bacterium]|nr:hypothetical protein [Phycisphaerales bacterium]